MVSNRCTRIAVFLLLNVGSLSMVGCRSSESSPTSDRTIRVEGSDTMVNLAQAWAEEYHKKHPDVSIQVSGGGSGVGIASLIEGVSDMANSSRRVKDSERARAKQELGKEIIENVVGMDALAIYVHPDNPLESLSIPQLAEIYGENGTITKWSQLGATNFGCGSDEITRVSRQNNSGTYHYFREAVLGENREYALGSIDQSGSKDVVALVASTPCAIGYSGMGYKTDEVKWLRITAASDDQGSLPSVESVTKGTYPISRPLLIYTLGEPSGIIKEYLDWIHSEEGQRVLLDLGYVPLPKQEAEAPHGSDQPSATDG